MMARLREMPFVVKVLAVVTAGAFVIAYFAGAGEDEPPARAFASPDSTVEVVYYVEGSAPGADLTMTDENGSTVQLSGKAVPLASKETGRSGLRFTTTRGSFLYISAQNTGESGTIRCRITADGRVVDEAASEGAYVIASCSGSA